MQHFSHYRCLSIPWHKTNEWHSKKTLFEKYKVSIWYLHRKLETVFMVKRDSWELMDFFALPVCRGSNAQSKTIEFFKENFCMSVRLPIKDLMVESKPDVTQTVDFEHCYGKGQKHTPEFLEFQILDAKNIMQTCSIQSLFTFKKFLNGHLKSNWQLRKVWVRQSQFLKNLKVFHSVYRSVMILQMEKKDAFFRNVLFYKFNASGSNLH